MILFKNNISFCIGSIKLVGGAVETKVMRSVLGYLKLAYVQRSVILFCVLDNVSAAQSRKYFFGGNQCNVSRQICFLVYVLT